MTTTQIPATGQEIGNDEGTAFVDRVFSWHTGRFLTAAFAFEATHDQADPAPVLATAFDALVPGGVIVMFGKRAASHLERHLDDGAGPGTLLGEESALQMLTDAGLIELEVHEVPGDPHDSVYVARKPG